jgi:hypothetical protein
VDHPRRGPNENASGRQFAGLGELTKRRVVKGGGTQSITSPSRAPACAIAWAGPARLPFKFDDGTRRIEKTVKPCCSGCFSGASCAEPAGWSLGAEWRRIYRPRAELSS